MSQQNILGTIRASSWVEFFDCQKRWEYTHIRGMQKKGSHQSAIGSAAHHGAAVFDAALKEGNRISPEEAGNESARHVIKHQEESVWDEVTPEKAGEMARNVTENYCRTIALEREWVAIEAQCKPLEIMTEYGVIRVTGTVDRIRKWESGALGVSDLKSGKTAVKSKTLEANTKAHGIQLGIYTLMAESELGIQLNAPGEIIGLNTTNDGRIGVGEIEDVKTPLIGTEDEPGLIEMAANMLSKGIMPPNPKSMMCSKKWCVGYELCPYHF